MTSTESRVALESDEAARVTAELFPRVRWMGSKYRLLPHLAALFDELNGRTALDAFSGSGVVSYLLKRQGYAVHSNDYLEFPTTLAKAAVENQGTILSPAVVSTLLSPKRDGRGFARDVYRGIYFDEDDLDFIDSVWSHIALLKGAERSIAIAALCLSAARRQPRGVFTISGDLSRYDDGRRDLRMSLRDHFPERLASYERAVFPGVNCSASTMPVEELPDRQYDVVYLDPPYAPPRDDNDYTKRFHFLEGLSRYWVGDELMWDTKTRKLPKRVTGYSSHRTIVEALRSTFRKFGDSTLVLSYSSNALPDADTIVSLLREVKSDVEVRAIPHTYHFGTHRDATRRRVSEYLFIAS